MKEEEKKYEYKRLTPKLSFHQCTITSLGGVHTQNRARNLGPENKEPDASRERELERGEKLQSPYKEVAEGMSTGYKPPCARAQSRTAT